MIYDVIIIGSGPAGLTAAIYTTRANLKTLVIAGSKWGGQLMLTTLVENFPGFPEGVQGPDLMLNMKNQAKHHGAEILDIDFIEADFSKKPLEIKAGDKVFKSKSVIIATGADPKWLNIKGEKEKVGKGVSTCAPCDAPFFRNKRVIVCGGGDSAMEEALVLSKFATEVIIVHRRSEFRASQVMQDKVFKNPKISLLFNSKITEISGQNKVEKVIVNSKFKIQNSKLQFKIQNEEREVLPEEIDGKTLNKTPEEIIWEMPIDGVFIAIGHKPNSEVFRGIELDNQGYVMVKEHFKTNIDGVFVAGDVHDANYRQAVTAAGFGCAAALEVEHYLEMQK